VVRVVRICSGDVINQLIALASSNQSLKIKLNSIKSMIFILYVYQVTICNRITP